MSISEMNSHWKVAGGQRVFRTFLVGFSRKTDLHYNFKILSFGLYLHLLSIDSRKKIFTAFQIFFANAKYIAKFHII